MSKSERRKASKDEDGADMISNLPDPVLLLILSRLPSTKEVIGTSILSRRWKYLWTSVPSLDLEKSTNLEKNKFLEFVYWVLLNRSVDLDRVRLFCSDVSMSTVERWIHAIVMRNVKRLDLKLPPEDIAMPHCLMTCASLEVLKLKFCFYRLILPSFSWLPALKLLKLSCVELFDDGLVKSFLESCPMLEELTLEWCVTDKINLCISCPNLKKLTICDFEIAGVYASIELFCPKLVFLYLRCRICSKFISEPIYSLKEAAIYTDGNSIDGLFPVISHVESLKTDRFTLYKCINYTRDPLLRNLKTLDLRTTNDFFPAEELTDIITKCPELKSLILSIANNDPWEEEPQLDGAERKRILTPDGKWVESFEVNGEKPKVEIQWSWWCENEWRDL